MFFNLFIFNAESAQNWNQEPKRNRPCVGLCYYEKLLRLQGKKEADSGPNQTAIQVIQVCASLDLCKGKGFHFSLSTADNLVLSYSKNKRNSLVSAFASTTAV